MLRVLDLFSGIGGFSLGLERTGGFKTVAFCEIEEFPRRVLAKHWPEVPCYHDVRELTADTLRRDGIAVDVICGGFPCQDISIAGTGEGLDGKRSGLWFEYRRLIGELGPDFVIVENVAELLGRGLGVVLGSLASLGYDAEWHCIPAAAVGAPHSRDRVWLMAYPEQKQRVRAVFDADYEAESLRAVTPQRRQDGLRSEVGTSGGSILGRWMDQPDPVGMADGVSDWPHRLAACGNAVVPQIPELIGRAILDSLATASSRAA